MLRRRILRGRCWLTPPLSLTRLSLFSWPRVIFSQGDAAGGYEDVEEEEDPEREVLAFEIKAADVSVALSMA